MAFFGKTLKTGLQEETIVFLENFGLPFKFISSTTVHLWVA
jgi:hypothetical protein